MPAISLLGISISSWTMEEKELFSGLQKLTRYLVTSIENEISIEQDIQDQRKGKKAIKSFGDAATVCLIGLGHNITQPTPQIFSSLLEL